MENRQAAQRPKARKVTEKADDAMFEEMFGGKAEPAVQTSARRTAAPSQTKQAAARNAQTEDPFADWERANARASAASRAAYNRAADTVDRVKAAAGSDDAFSEFLTTSAPKKTEKTREQKAAPAKPKAAPAVSEDDFDLDSILNEFK